jgi:sigma-B regulation protein RsbU (phosphoserine phosphatase)
MKPTRILVVDDEPGMLRAIERVLAPHHQVTISGSSTQALELAARAEPDLAILDIRMPELDGFELMAHLKSRHPDIDVILMTGSVDDQDDKLIRAIRGAAFYYIQKPFDRDVLKTLVDRCVELRQRRDENRRHVLRLEQELAAARAFQQGLLPEPDVVLAGTRISCRQTASSELGGDLYDYARDRSGRTALLIADVAGHGASAAMLTAVVKSAFRAAEPDDYHPSSVTERVRAGIAPFGFERFVTLIAARISSSEKHLLFVNAGHPPGFFWNARGRRERLPGTGPLLSPAIPDAQWACESRAIGPGDHLLLFTDGVTDALYQDDDSESRLRAVIEQHAGVAGAVLLEALLAEIDRRGNGHPPQDDVTLVTATLL